MTWHRLRQECVGDAELTKYSTEAPSNATRRRWIISWLSLRDRFIQRRAF